MIRGFFASLYKDIKLMSNKAGIFSLIFCIMLLPVFLFATKNLSLDISIGRFPIAVVDEDNSFMSSSLIYQLKEIELFSEVNVINGKENIDTEEILKDNAGAVTIPKDFFYALYSGEDCPVTVVLNDKMPLEAAVFNSVITSVMDIISADQSSWRGQYKFVYGELDEDLIQELYKNSSMELLSDALGRQNVFKNEINLYDGILTRRRITASILIAMFSMLFAVSSLKNIYEERKLGSLTRYMAGGASYFSFVLSKFISCFIWMLPIILILYFLSGISDLPMFILLCLFSLLSCFIVAFGFVSVSENEMRFIGISNLYISVSFLISMTASSYRAKSLFIFKYILRCLNAVYEEKEGIKALGHMKEFFLIALIMLASGIIFRIARKKILPKGSNIEIHKNSIREYERGDGQNNIILRYIILCVFKIRLYTGGAAAVIVILASAVISGYLAGRSLNSSADSVVVAAADNDKSVQSEKLIGLIKEKSDGISIIEEDIEKAEKSLLDLEVEGILVINEGFGDRIINDKRLLLEYCSKDSSFSAQAVREVIAGKAAVLRSAYRAVNRAEELLGRELDYEEINRLNELIYEEYLNLPKVYKISYLSGDGVSDPFKPDILSYLSMVLMLIVVNLSAYTAKRETRVSKARLLALKSGRLLDYITDLAAIYFMSAAICVGFLAASDMINIKRIAVGLLFSFNISALSIPLSKMLYKEGRIDILVPLITLIICFTGGCFIDISALAGGLSDFIMISPAGSALFAAGGSGKAVIFLLVEALIFIKAGIPERK